MVKLYLTFVPERAFSIREEALSFYRREKLAHQKNEHVRRQSALSELLLRFALRDCGFPPAAALEIQTGERGKPYLADESRGFSLSHSGNAILCAIGERELGADIQLLTPANEALMRRFYAPDERRFVLAAAERDTAFTEIWTMKESYCKATGLGLSLPLASFSILDESIARSVRHGAMGEYCFSVSADQCDLPDELEIIHVENSALLE